MGLCGSSAVDNAGDGSNWTLQKRRTQDKYVITKTLGEGASCRVVVAKDIQTKTEYALKILDKDGQMGDAQELFLMEVKLLRMLKHPNILRFEDAYESTNAYNLVTGLCKGGELFDRVAEGKFSEKTAAQITRSMLLALCHCHASNVVHRDLKPENFVFETKAEDSDMKLIDFGCALLVRDDEKITDVAGSPYYVAPEVLDKNYERTGAIWKAADMWSIGVIVYLLVHGYPPFNGEEQADIFKRIRRGRYRCSKKIGLSREVKDLISKLLVKEPTQRLTAEEALAHAWVADPTVAPDQALPAGVVKGLQAFGNAVKLKKAVVKMMNGGKMNSEGEKKVVRQLFAKYDRDGNGKLDAHEVKDLLKDIGVASNPQAFIEQFDDDGDGHIDLDEFKEMKAMVDYEKDGGASQQKLEETFKKLDTDGSGALSAAEIASLLQTSEENAAAHIKRVDADGNGEVDLDEFLTLMQAVVQKK